MDKIRLMDNPEARKLVMPSAGMDILMHIVTHEML